MSKAVRAGRLTAGIRFDDRGNIVVSDADAAERQWREVHVDEPWHRGAGGKSAANPNAADLPPGVYVDVTWPPMRRALEDPLIAAHPMALFCLIDSALRDAPDPAGAAAELLARTAIGMPDVEELLAREVASWLEADSTMEPTP